MLKLWCELEINDEPGYGHFSSQPTHNLFYQNQCANAASAYKTECV